MKNHMTVGFNFLRYLRMQEHFANAVRTNLSQTVIETGGEMGLTVSKWLP